MQGEKATLEIHENTAGYSKQVQEAAPNKTAAVWPLISNLSYRQT